MSLSASHFKRNIIMIFILLMVFLAGCSQDLRNSKKDPFFEKWNTLADNSQGYSPEMKPKKIDIAPTTENKSPSASFYDDTEKKLPTKTINLTMRQAELKAVLRALAKAVDYNLLVKNDLKGEVSVDFRSVPWDQAFTGLLKTHGMSYVWEGRVIRVMTIEDMEQELKQKVQMRDIQWVEPLMNPIVIKIDYADPKKLMETLQEFLTKDKDGKPRGSVKLDEHSNSLVISANARDLARMIPVVEKIDKPTTQILIKANIVETTKNVARDLGVMWGGMYKGNLGNKNIYVTPGGTSGNTTSDPLAGNYNPTAGSSGISGHGFAGNFPISNITNAAAAGSLGLIYGVIGQSLLEVQLQALQQNNQLNILSSPSITTLDNQKAFTENGERVPYVTKEIDSSGKETRTVKFEDVVLRLEIIPHVIDGNHLKMNIIVKKDEVDPLRNVDGNPYIIKKQTQTVLIVEDGETIVISGLTKQRNAFGDSGWPWLKDIPGLGYLFKTDSKSEDMEEVLIFITPRILKIATAENKVSAKPPDKDASSQTGK